jgi:hypothetical protein
MVNYVHYILSSESKLPFEKKLKNRCYEILTPECVTDILFLFFGNQLIHWSNWNIWLRESLRLIQKTISWFQYNFFHQKVFEYLTKRSFTHKNIFSNVLLPRGRWWNIRLTSSGCFRLFSVVFSFGNVSLSTCVQDPRVSLASAAWYPPSLTYIVASHLVPTN